MPKKRCFVSSSTEMIMRALAAKRRSWEVLFLASHVDCSICKCPREKWSDMKGSADWSFECWGQRSTGGQEFGPCYQPGGTHYFSLRHDEADCTDRWNHGQPIGASPTRPLTTSGRCRPSGATWMAQGPTSLMPRQPLKRPDAKTLPGNQRSWSWSLSPAFPGLVGSYPYFWKHLHSGKLT